MSRQKPLDTFATIVTAGLLLLTAFADARLMLVVSILALALGLIFYKWRLFRGALLVATVGALTAIAIAIYLLMR